MAFSHNPSQRHAELTEANVRTVPPQRVSSGRAPSSVATSSISIHPTRHCVDRQAERDVTHREIQSAMRHGVWRPDPEGHPRRHMVSDAVTRIFVIVQDSVTPVTAWRGSFSAGANSNTEQRPDSGNSVLVPAAPPNFHEKLREELERFYEANEYVIDKYGSMGGYGNILEMQLSNLHRRVYEEHIGLDLPDEEVEAHTAQVLGMASMTDFALRHVHLS
mmetsp:Transcript_62681/g.123925  ORF Transcript_62681/g.123925 Transcript_62681/m.123925 type:complete len:219 (+) Transcript_62681:73-729(+)